MNPNMNPNKKPVVEEKKQTIGTAAHDVEGPKTPVKTDTVTAPVVKAPEGTLEPPKRPA